MNGMLLLHRDRPRCAAFVLSINLTVVGTSRCDVPARETAGGTVAPLHGRRSAPSLPGSGVLMRELFSGNLSNVDGLQSVRGSKCQAVAD